MGQKSPKITLAYVRTVEVTIALLFLLAIWRDPYAADFERLTLPALLLLASLQTLLLPLPWYRQLTCGSIFFAIAGLFFSTVPQMVATLPFSVFAFAFMAIYTIAICATVVDLTSRNLSIAQSFWVTFILLVGQILQSHHVQTKGHESSRLFALPLIVMVVWIESSLSGWGSSSRFAFIIGVFQIVIGLFDVGMREHLRLLEMSSYGLALIALVFLVRWPQKLFPSKTRVTNNGVKQGIS